MTPSAESVGQEIAERFAPDAAPVPGPVGHPCLLVPPARIVDVVRWLKAERGYDLLADLTCVDFPSREPRFEVVYNLYSIKDHQRLFLKVRPPGPEPAVPTLTEVYRAADWFEREVWDMFGVRFAGHPNLVRILMYDSFVGHPLRKDYDARHRQPLIAERTPTA